VSRPPFGALQAVLDLLAPCPFPWAVAGGWAVDLFLGRITREHDDFEIAIDRDDQRSVRDYFRDWTCLKVIPGKGRFAWEMNEHLDLPIHEIHVAKGPWNLEILLNEFQDGYWIFRRNPEVKREQPLFHRRRPGGVTFVAPEIVLLYKAKANTDKDRQDFMNVLACLDNDRKKWLKDSLNVCHPQHEWLSHC